MSSDDVDECWAYTTNFDQSEHVKLQPGFINIEGNGMPGLWKNMEDDHKIYILTKLATCHLEVGFKERDYTIIKSLSNHIRRKTAR